MSSLRLSLACADYDRTRPLREGRVRATGIEFDYLPLKAQETFWRQIKNDEFDVCEMSLSAYIIGLSRGEDRHVGLPVFPSRVFRHSAFYVSHDSTIRRPEDLIGCRIGVPEYHMTAALFARGMLSDEYGVRPSDVSWVQGGLHEPGRRERVELRLPPTIDLTVNRDDCLDDLLLDGKIDALISPDIPRSYSQPEPAFRRLFTDCGDVEAAYYAKTGIFPIMHMLVVRKDVVERHPWVPREVVKAFAAAKDIAERRLREELGSETMLPFLRYEVERTYATMGTDYWPYGVESNMATLEAAVRYSFEQGLSARKVEVAELYGALADDESFRS